VKGRLSFLVLVVVAAATVASAASGAPVTARAERIVSLEQSILRELNDMRSARGLRPLRLSRGLQVAALGHSRAMLSSGFFSHSSSNGASFSDRIRRSYSARGFVGWTVGENILFDSAAIDAPATIAAWMASPPHRRNLLSPAWREVGIGVARNASAPGVFDGGSAWVVTMDFGARAGAKKPAA
jgi:uncharacterized protein YkwD